jgi:hypothetical protein
MWLLMLASVLAVAPEAQVQTLTGQTVAGRVTSLVDEKLVLAAADGERTFSAGDLLGITLSAPATTNSEAATAWVALVDGSQLVARSYTVKGTDARAALVGGGVVEVPTRSIDSVRFREHSAALSDQWAEIAKGDRSGDLLIVRKSDALDFWSGVVRDVADDVVLFELDGEVLRVKRQKVDGILYRVASQKNAVAKCSLTDVAGSQLHVASLTLDGDSLRARTTAGVDVVRPLAAWARIDFSQGNLQYLGDLKPESAVWTPYLGEADDSPAARGFFRPSVDRSLDGGALRLGGREYAKGLALHSRTELSYRLPEKYRMFTATAGIDDRVRPAGNVRLVIMGDERTLFDDTLSGEDAPRALELDVSGASRLKLIVDFGDDMDVGDAMDLCEARLSK